MQCHGADEWVSSGRANMAELRGDIETYRRALGLVLDVVNYHHSPFNSDTSNLDTSKSQITTEVDRLRSHTALTGLDNRNTWLEPYMNAVINCLEITGADSPVIKGDGPPKDLSLNLESQQPATPPSAPTQQESSPKYVINSVYETAGPWYPPAGAIALPFYNGGENPASVASSPRREPQQVSPRLRNSPLDPSRHAPTPESPTSIQFSQRAQSPPSSQQSWDRGSPSARSEPFEASYVPHQDLRADRWSEPQPIQNPEHYNHIVSKYLIPGYYTRFSLVTTVPVPKPTMASKHHSSQSYPSMVSHQVSGSRITTHFGLDLEIYNFTKGGSGKKVQVIDEAHRWAASHKLDNSYAPLVIYRPGADRIDRYFLSRNPGAKKPFWEDASSCIDLTKADLPFLPKWPELAFSNDSPFLIAAAGPRPGDPPRDINSNILLVAWHLTPVQEAKLQARSPVNSVHSHIQESGDPKRHKPYRFCAPAYTQLQTALPSVLVSHGSVTVSIWIPASHVNIPLPGGKFRQTRVPTPERFVLVWDMPTNTTRLIPIPNVQACVSPDCRLVAYCDPEIQKFVILDVTTAEMVWKWPDAAAVSGFASFGQFEAIKKITVFEFSPDGKWLIVGDASGALGVYEVREAGTRFELLDQSSLKGVSELGGGNSLPRGNVAELM
ncbi:LOW QUALITY PROTEIN: hypothetical protein B0H65DRAFT_507859 [Neurospora tetraspora]|uniref:WD40 repeat-like protein n=1 Tax=Neurospora tetraspora TaxID=94610 RepID=A0AAE0MSU0_9PEZI|nr:LOW QUALITY PROTEIN: hypothetical protein B0H65DRAFT_507859 [Neurospora tetraspora]